MPRLTISQTAAIAAILAFTALPLVGDAYQLDFPTKIITTKAPVALTHCASFKDPGNFVHITNDAINRSSIFLTSYVVRWFAYDHSGVEMGQGDSTYTFDSDLAPNDTTSRSEGVYFLTEPVSSLASMACRMESAKFEGGRSWTYGRPWNGPLAPLPHQASNDQSTPIDQLAAARTAGHIDATVTNAWNDTVNGKLFVHVALDLHAIDGDAAFGPENIKLNMLLADGSRRTYNSLTAAAPTYQKIDALGQSSTTKMAYEVNPKEDLGQLGTVHVSAQSKTHVVATFPIGADAVTNPNDNRQIRIH